MIRMATNARNGHLKRLTKNCRSMEMKFVQVSQVSVYLHTQNTYRPSLADLPSPQYVVAF